MQVLGVLVAILIVSGATDAEVEEERAVIQGFHCDYLILSDVPSISGCNDGFKFVVRKRRGVRSQYLILGGKTVLAFLKQGQKFSRCRSFNNITPRVTCKGPVGGLKPNFTPGNWTAGGDGAGPCPEFCIEIYQPVCGSNGETYSNGCYLQMAACASTTPITQAYEGECAECPAEQPEFGTACSLPEGAQCPYGEECCCGECHPNMMMECGGGSWAGYHTEACMFPNCGNTTGCPEVCPAIFDPVCGSDGNTYSNECQLEVATCNSPVPITIVSQGECGSGAMEDQTISWARGMSPVQLCVTPGTSVTFDWTSGHNMEEVSEDSYESCTGFAKTSPEAGPATWLAPSEPSVNYFACGVPGHCSGGMKAMIEVKAVCPS